MVPGIEIILNATTPAIATGGGIFLLYKLIDFAKALKLNTAVINRVTEKVDASTEKLATVQEPSEGDVSDEAY